jgi:hypothetical protein
MRIARRLRRSQLQTKGSDMKTCRTIRALLVACAVLVVSGCASLPPSDVMKTETANYQLPKLPDPGQALVYVVRPSSLGGLIRFNVFLNDQKDSSEIGYTRSSQYIYFGIPPGDHKIYSKAENWAEILVSAKAGDIFFIQQEPTMGVSMARNNLFRLEDYQGKYHVKTLTLGTLLKAEK